MQTSPLQRLWGIDLARFLAIVGMMAAHLVVIRGDAEWLRPITSGFPSSLFAVLGGFGLVFAARRYTGANRWQSALAAGLTRGAIVLVIGLMMELLPAHPIYVILVYYGAALILLAPLVTAPTWVLSSVAVLLGVSGPFIIATNEHPGFLDYSGLGPLTQSVLIGGTYPVITWVVYMLAGMVLCRWMLNWRAQGKMWVAGLGMLLGGAAVAGAAWTAGTIYRNTVLLPQLVAAGASPAEAVQILSESGVGTPNAAGWAAVLQMNPHSGTTVDMLLTGGSAVAIIGLSLLVSARWRKVPTLLRPVIGMGAAPLTSYTLHLVMTSLTLVAVGGIQAYFNHPLPPLLQHAFVLQVVVLLFLGAYLSFAGKRGPLELLVSKAAQAAARSVEKTI